MHLFLVIETGTQIKQIYFVLSLHLVLKTKRFYFSIVSILAYVKQIVLF
jgi:hypothetical protein